MRLLPLLMSLLLALCACAAPTPNEAQTATEDADEALASAPQDSPRGGATPAAPDSTERSATTGAAPVPPTPNKPMRTGGPLPPEPVENADSGDDAPAAIDTRCRTDADCTVKNVGNCCGYAPACVNVASPTDPEGVRAQCAKQGMASVCGFQEISACTCNRGRCEAQAAQVQ